MILDAFLSEWSKAIRQPRAIFWGFVFIPVAAFVVEVVKLLWIKAKFPQMAAMAAPLPMKSLIEACGTAHNPLALLFLILGAAHIFAGEYRWNTWRYLLVRNGRAPVLTAKLMVFVLLAGVSIVLCMIGGLLGTVIDGAINHAAFRPEAAGAPLGVLMTFGLVLLNLAGVGAITALASVFSRSQTGAIIAVIVFLIVLAFAGQMAMQFRILWLQQVEPGLALNRLVTPALEMAGQIPRGSDAADANWPADLAVMAGWLALPALAALGLFIRQDLSRE